MDTVRGLEALGFDVDEPHPETRWQADAEKVDRPVPTPREQSDQSFQYKHLWEVKVPATGSYGYVVVHRGPAFVSLSAFSDEHPGANASLHLDVRQLRDLLLVLQLALHDAQGHDELQVGPPAVA